jgi:LuxR family maltose regulon positive regulatory protein
VGFVRTPKGACRAPVYAFTPVETSLYRSLSSPSEQRKITTLVAPPGYGKTVLLSQLYHHYSDVGVDCVWIGLEERDTSLGAVLTKMEAAFGVFYPGRSLTTSLPATDAVDRMEGLQAHLEQQAGSLAIFVDNIDFCHDNVGDLIDQIVFHTPENIILLVSSASTPVPFNAAKAHLEGLVRTIGMADLTFDCHATAQLFAQAGINHIDTPSLEAVVRRTEGWPAAVRLLQLIVDNEKRLDRGIELLSGDDVHVADLLSRRLMASLEPDLVQFLYEICEFRRFSRDLAFHATADERAPLWIDFLVERNFLIVPLDGRREWYRFHTLLREFLVKEARRHLPAARRTVIHQSAARWLVKNGDCIGALELAIGANDLAMASGLLDQVACLLVRDQGDTSAFLEWLHRSDQAGIPRGIHATFWYVWSLLFEQQYEAARDEARRALDRVQVGSPTDFARELTARLDLVMVLAALHLDSLGVALSDAETWLQAHANGDAFDVSAAAGASAVALLPDFRFAEARNVLFTAESTIVRSTTVYGRCWVETVAAMTDLAQGNPAAAEGRLLELEGVARRDIAPTASIASIVAVVRAAALYDLGQFDEAEEVVAANLERAVRHGIPDTSRLALEVAAAFAVAGRDPFSVNGLRKIARTFPKRVSLLFELQLVRLYLLREELEEAVELASGLGWDARSGWPASLLASATEMEKAAAAFTTACLLTALGHLAVASDLIQAELRQAQDKGRRRAQVELLLLAADVQMRMNARASALRHLSRAVCVAAKRNLLGPFLERRRVVLAHLIENSKPKELGLTSREELALYVEIQHLIGGTPAEEPRGDFLDGLVEPLSPREIELLHLLEAGLDNARIAERLIVTVRTIKWHLSNLYSKLGVKSRSAAVAKARALRLLQQ